MAVDWVNKGSLKGPKGDKGETGAQGIQGFSFRTVNTALSPSASVQKSSITPNTNIQKGDKLQDPNGDIYEIASVEDQTVSVGATKIASVKGPQGDKGETGDKGEDGTGVNIKGSVNNAEALPPTGEPGDAYVLADSGNLAVWDENQNKFVDTGAQIKGPKGDTGAQGVPGTAATIKVGTVNTSDPGSNATVTNAGDTTNATFNFTIPRGAQGVPGPGVSVGSGAPSEPGTNGECYIDITTGNVYRCEEAGA